MESSAHAIVPIRGQVFLASRVFCALGRLNPLPRIAGECESSVRSDSVNFRLREGSCSLKKFLLPILLTVVSSLAGEPLPFPSLSPRQALAQSTNQTPPSEQSSQAITHTPPSASSLPALGEKMTLTAFIKGSQEFEQPARIFLVRDGLFWDIWLPTGRLDMSERTFYDFEIYAPEQSLRYRFLWYPPPDAQGHQRVVVSPEYSVQRSCRYDARQVSADAAVYNPLAENEATETKRLFHVSDGLSREIAAYQEATRLLGELRKKVNSLSRTNETTSAQAD